MFVASKPPGSDAGSQFGLEEQIAGEQCPHSKKKITNMILMFDPRLKRENHSKVCIVTESCFEHFMRFRCSFPKFEAKFHANAFSSNQSLHLLLKIADRT
jgi:hypothetical protein